MLDPTEDEATWLLQEAGTSTTGTGPESSPPFLLAKLKVSEHMCPISKHAANCKQLKSVPRGFDDSAFTDKRIAERSDQREQREAFVWPAEIDSRGDTYPTGADLIFAAKDTNSRDQDKWSRFCRILRSGYDATQCLRAKMYKLWEVWGVKLGRRVAAAQ